MKVVLFSNNDEEIVSAVAALGREVAVTQIREPLNVARADEHADADIVSGFAGCDFGAACLKLLPKVRFIAIRATGFDNVDLDYCRLHGIKVSNVPVYGDSTVAEHAFGLLLALSRSTTVCAEATRHGDFAHIPAKGFELRDKTFGVIGTGHIGRRAIEMAHGFGMSVVGYDAFPSSELNDVPNFRYASLDEVLAVSDIVSLHVPATPETTAMIGESQFGRMKRGAVLINTARGQVVDTPALLRSLETGHLRAAGLDVLPHETSLRNSSQVFDADPAIPAGVVRDILASRVLATMPNVIVTPHNAYNTVEASRRIAETTVANIKAFLAGQPINLVN